MPWETPVREARPLCDNQDALMGRGLLGVTPHLQSPVILPFCIEEHKTSHIVTWAGFQNRAVGVGLPETQPTIIFCRDSALLLLTFMHQLQDMHPPAPMPQFKLLLSLQQ